MSFALVPYEEKESIRTCQHSSIYRVIDDQDGTIICAKCCLVLADARFIHDDITRDVEKNKDDLRPIDLLLLNPTGSLEGEKEEESESTLGDIDLHPRLKSDLEDWIENAHLPKCILQPVSVQFKRMTRDLNEKSVKIRQRLVKSNEVLAAALYVTLIEARVPRTSCMIAFFTNVDEERIRSIAEISSGMDSLSTNRASIWMPLVGPEFNLSYTQSNEICELADSIQGEYSFSPLSILLAVICIYLSTDGSPRAVREVKKKAVEVSNLSAPTLNRTVKKLQSNETIRLKIKKKQH